ncbi:MAG TPA: hypothetical protein VK250_12435, partial [Nitrososphaeraceae archaeon]|nr:hypothetical protein [Nitrososphaeraceae archaeon]
SHPINPIRIKAIQLFGESELYRNALNGNVEIKTDESLEESIMELIRILLIMTSSDLARHRQHFIASAGLIVASADEKIDKIEAEEILSILSNYTIFPEDFLDAVSKSEKVEEIFRQSIENILAANPGERVSMMEFLIMISISNRDIAQKEIDFLFHAGTELLGFSRKEVAQILAEQIRSRFMPEVF